MASRDHAILFITMVMLIYRSQSQENAWRFRGPNVAVGKNASQYLGVHVGFGADRAVDNITTPDSGLGFCSHTDWPNPGPANWTVDLARIYVIKGIRIYNRNTLQERLQHFKIYGDTQRILLYDDDAANVKLYSQLVLEIPITIEVPVSTVTIEIPPRGGDGAILTLCEVQVFVYDDCTPPPDVYNGVYLEDIKPYYVAGEAVNWACIPGYSPRTNMTRHCKANTATWTKQGSSCKKNCILNFNLTNAEINIIRGENNTLDGDTEQVYGRDTVLEVICHGGYETNVTNITCGQKGTWDYPAVCDTVLCGRPENFTGGVYTYTLSGTVLGDKDWYIYSTVATATCNGSYEVAGGAESRTCSHDGSWTGQTPICVKSEKIPITVPKTNSEPPVSAAMVGGGAGGVIALLAAIIIVTMLVRKRRRSPHKMKMPTKEPFAGDSNANINDIVVYSEVQELEAMRQRRIVADDTQSGAYYSFNTQLSMPERGIRLEELSDFVLAADFFHEKYTKEFKSFPDGMTKQHKAALRNKTKNKYKNILPYDDTRVVMEIWSSKKEKKQTDYINASYIHGFTKPKAYIASQGVTKENINDFWRMIWQNNCGKIVMLTNVMEDAKIKCEQYWPSSGPTSYGSVQVTIKTTETFSNFVIRHLSVRRKHEASRRVLHFHFTAWPDKDVPQYCTALVHFRAKVKTVVTECDGPLVVHCSAGVGRTGTYIALDYLTDMGRTLGVVDVPGIVETLRRQRVNMVQTKEQYIFVHQALVETLMLSTSALPTSKFIETYEDLKTVDPVKQKRKIDVEFEVLANMPSTFEENQYAMVKKGQSREKNRYSNVNPVIQYMPSLCGPGMGGMRDGYINAVFLPSYKDRQALIVTQSPLETTQHDFWNMIYHQDVTTIVMMNQKSEMTEADIYWPEVNEEVEVDDMKILNKSTEKAYSHVMVTLTLETKYMKRDIKLIQFGEWKVDNPTPSDPEHILTTLKLVQEWQCKTGNNPVVVHCMNGAEKSGLFCVLYGLLERTKIEHDVAIPQVIQELRHRRQQIIPNVGQFVFCHDVVLLFLNQFEMYSNFV